METLTDGTNTFTAYCETCDLHRNLAGYHFIPTRFLTNNKQDWCPVCNKGSGALGVLLTVTTVDRKRIYTNVKNLTLYLLPSAPIRMPPPQQAVPIAVPVPPFKVGDKVVALPRDRVADPHQLPGYSSYMSQRWSGVEQEVHSLYTGTVQLLPSGYNYRPEWLQHASTLDPAAIAFAEIPSSSDPSSLPREHRAPDLCPQCHSTRTHYDGNALSRITEALSRNPTGDPNYVKK